MDLTRDKCLEMIDLYHQRPILWNPRHPSYFNKVKKDDAWREIAEICGRDIEDIQRKFESLKGSYRRERAKVKKSTGTGKDEKYTSKWFAFDYLRFLDDKDEPRKSISNLQFDSAEGINSSSEIDDITEEQLNDTVTEDSQKDEPTQETPQRAVQTELKTKTFKSPPKLAARRRIVEEDPRIKEAFGYLKKVSAATSSEVKDDCSVFGEHVAKKICEFDENLKNLAQHRISNILFELEISRYDNVPKPQSFPSSYPHQTTNTNQYDHQQASNPSRHYSFGNYQLTPEIPQTPPTPISRSSTPSSRSDTNSALGNYFENFSDDTCNY